ncbi:MAG: hypothetical protein JSU96_15965 [Acidobacteriota bacterium]|nr:MAG: hypothetical protein JSU96_15965 [Acidobacteriota bacterium]
MLVWLLPTGLFAQSAQETPSLAELAKREQERRAQQETEVRVITNADLKQLRSARVVTTATQPTKSQTDAVQEVDPDQAAADEKDEAAKVLAEWRQRFQEARGRLEMAVNQVLVLQLKMNELRNGYLSEPDGARREQINALIASTFDEVQRQKEEEAAARKAIMSLQQEALQAGLLAGEVREMTGMLPVSSSITELDSTPTP